MQELNGTNVPETDGDPITSVIHELANLSTDAVGTTDDTIINSDEKIPPGSPRNIFHKASSSHSYSHNKHAPIYNDEEDLEESVGSPDSLDMCKVNDKPIPPPRTKLLTPQSASNNIPAGSSSLHNVNTYKQLRSESDNELVLSLKVSGEKS